MVRVFVQKVWNGVGFVGLGILGYVAFIKGVQWYSTKTTE